jgi:DNA-binding beta-propeller fold protein YncE
MVTRGGPLAASAFLRALVLAFAAAACSSSSSTVAGEGGAPESGATHEAGTSKEAGPPVDRGPKSIAIANADPNGMFWDAATSTLYIADNLNDAVITWTDQGGFEKLVSLPGPTGNEVGGLVQLADGTLVVIEFGFGTSGLVALVYTDLKTGSVPNLDPTRRRLGIALAPDGSLYDTYFAKVSGGSTGFVGKLDVTAGTEENIITGLMKPVGVAVIGSTLYFSDQTLGEILAAPLASPQSYKTLSTNLSPDLLSVGPNGTIFSGSPSGVVYQIDTTTGTFNTLFTAGGTLEPRGTAYDAVNKRLFVAEHDSSDVQNYIEIVPVGG